MPRVGQIDNAKTMGRYFLPYQLDAIVSEARLEAWEKSIRIGATYCKAFRAVRRRMLGHGDYLHTSVSLPAALEFVSECNTWNGVFNVAAASMGEIDWDDSIEGKAYQIKYPNGGRIIAFSSNPNSVRSFGGEVGIDEYAFHKDPKAMLKAAGGRAMWGYPVALWSSHNGVESEWNRFLTAQRAAANGTWLIRRTTILDAIEAGLVEKINETRGTTFTRETFLADCKEICGSEEGFKEECLCEPMRDGETAIKWHHLEKARKEYGCIRLSMSQETTEVLTHAMTFAASAASAQFALGFDVARRGDLASVWLNRKVDDAWRLVLHVKMHNTEFRVMRGVVSTLMRLLPSCTGAGDATGMGMQICEELGQEFGDARWTQVNFSSMKPALGTKLVRVFEDGRQELPLGAAHDDLVYDLAGIRTESSKTGKVVFYETPNPIEKRSHCDMAWSCALALFAGDETKVECGVY